MMYYDRQTQEVCQILEGPRKQVLELYEIIERIEPVTYRLAFLSELEKIHNIFHVSML